MTKCEVCPYSHLNKKGKLECKWKICMLEFDDSLREKVFKVLVGSKEK